MDMGNSMVIAGERGVQRGQMVMEKSTIKHFKTELARFYKIPQKNICE